jgi:Zn-finger protein
MPENILEIWEKNHFIEVAKELKSENIGISHENIPAIIDAMGFERRSKRNPEKCPYYRMSPPRPCHGGIKDFNCLLCACPNYDSRTSAGGCMINSKKGHIYNDKVWDCSDCKINHSRGEVEEYLRKNLGKLIDIYYSI